VRYRTPLLAAIVSVATFSQAAAEESFVPYAGAFDIDDKTALQIGAEYRYEDIFYGLRPTVGASVTDDGSLYGYGGVNWDLGLGSSWYLTPNFMVGAYSDGDDGTDLGGALEFRSGLELTYAFENDSRVGVAFNHISNASIYDDNPGAESLLFVYHHPVSVFGD
jgi:hypothetical protein